MRWLITASCLAAALAGLAARSPRIDEQQPTFRDRTRIVSVYATVRDGAGHFVPDLVRGDFRVFDDGHERPIEVFENTIEPLAVVIMRDDSDSMRPVAALRDEAVRQFLGDLLPTDRVRLAAFSDAVRFSPRWTADHDDLREQLNGLKPRGGMTNLGGAIRAGLTELRSQTDGSPVLLVLSDAGATGVAALTPLVPERVTVVFLGISNGSAGSATYLREAFQFASESGGGYELLKPKEDPGPVCERISDELHHRYLLGFSPTALDGRTHTIQVRVNTAGLVARARSSYVAVDRRNRASLVSERRQWIHP